MLKSEYSVRFQLILEIISALMFLSMSLLDIFFSLDYMFIIYIFLFIIIFILLVIKNKNLEEVNDESVKSILYKVNEKSIIFLFNSIFIIGMLSTTPDVSNIFISIDILGIILMTILLIFTIFRFILFNYYDKKGIFD